MNPTPTPPPYTRPTVTPLPQRPSSVMLPGGVELLMPRRYGRWYK